VIAAEVGCSRRYQAHLIRDFHRIASGPPSEFARRRPPDRGGVIGD
jgi:hypothetical protein